MEAGDADHGKTRERDIGPRALRFAVRIVKVVNALPRRTAEQVVARQLMRSGSSVGANISEAQGAQSRSDFVRRMNIARGEAHEALYWLRLIEETEMVTPDRLQGVLEEADELVRILTAIVKKTRSG